MKKKTKRKDINFDCPCCADPYSQCPYITCDSGRKNKKHKNKEKQEIGSIFEKTGNFIENYWDMIFYLSIAIIPIGCISIFSYKSGQISSFVLTIVLIIWGALWGASFVVGI